MRGFAAMVAVFILVVLGGMGAVLVSVSGTQQRASAFDALGARAYQAARTGIEVAAYKALNGSCGAASFSTDSMTVNMTCSQSGYDEAGQSVPIYEITATACNAAACGNADGGSYVERQLRATFAGGA